jgi:c-di-GMP-binding flagellar brake protein YcgR
VLESHVSEVTVKVRRITALTRDAAVMRYRIGLEFLAISPDAEDAINQIVMANQAQV